MKDIMGGQSHPSVETLEITKSLVLAVDLLLREYHVLPVTSDQITIGEQPTAREFTLAAIVCPDELRIKITPVTHSDERIKSS